MKRFLILFIICTVMAFTCRKEENHFEGITGTWELVEIQAGMMPTEHPSPLTERLIISSDKFELRSKDTVVIGNYSIVEDPTVKDEVCLEVKPGEYTQRIVLTGSDHEHKTFFQLDGLELKTLSGCFALDRGVYKKYMRLGDPGNAVH